MNPMETIINRIASDLYAAKFDRVKWAERDTLKAKCHELAKKHFADMKFASDVLVQAEAFLSSGTIDTTGKEVWIGAIVEQLECGRYTIRTKTAADIWQTLASEYATKIRAVLSMHLTPLIEPDVPPPTNGSGEYTYGYEINTHGNVVRVQKAASSTSSHWSTWQLDAPYPKPGNSSRESWSQQPIHLYSTYELALNAGRAKLAWEMALSLAKIDQQIDQLKRKEWTQKDASSAGT